MQYRELSMKQIEEEIQRVKQAGGNPKRVFLGDGNAFGLETGKLLKLLEMIHMYFPACEGINMDATVTNVMEKTDEELRELKAAGVDELYLGIETGLDDVLTFMLKDHDLQQVYAAIKRLYEAGLAYDAHMMTGIAGKGRGQENAEALARFYNRTKPRKIVNFSLFLHREAPLYKDIETGRFEPADELENLMEERRLLELLEVENVKYDGFHDFLGVRVRGTLPEDKEKMLAKLDKVIKEMTDKEPLYAYVDGCCCELDMYEMTDPEFR